MGRVNFSAVFATLISSVTAYFVALNLGVKPEKYTVTFQNLDVLVVVKLLLLVAICGVVGFFGDIVSSMEGGKYRSSRSFTQRIKVYCKWRIF